MDLASAPDALEKTLLEPMDKFIPSRLVNETSTILISLIMASEEDREVIYKKFKQTAWQLSALEERISHGLTVSIDKTVLCLITVLTEGNIGKMILYAYYLQYWGKKHNVKDITLDNLCEDIFPRGFFSDEDMNKFWDLQKIGGANMIDDPSASKSIHF